MAQMLPWLAALATAHGAAAASNATVGWGTQRLRVSSVGPEQMLPTFASQMGHATGAAPTAPAWKDTDLGIPLTPGAMAPGYHDSCPDAVFRNSVMQLGGALPYQPIYDIGCESFGGNATEVKVAVLENEYLRVAVMRTGGKIWSIYDKKKRRELLYSPPAIQPGINSFRPWGPGGMEWVSAPPPPMEPFDRLGRQSRPSLAPTRERV
jgi:hypothetical protein